MKRWLALFAVLMVACVAAWFVLRERPDPPGPLDREFEKVQVGMTRAEVEAIMGQGREVYRRAKPGDPPNLGGGLWWQHSSRYYEVYFTLDDGRAVEKGSGRLRWDP